MLSRQFLALAVMLSVVLNPALAAVLCGLDCEKAMDGATSPVMVMSEAGSETPPCHEQMVHSVSDADQPGFDMSPEGQDSVDSVDGSGISGMNSTNCDCPDHCSVISIAVTTDQSYLMALPKVAEQISEPVRWLHMARSANPFRPPIA